MPPKPAKPVNTPATAAAAIPAANAAAANPNKPKVAEVQVSKINFKPQMQAFKDQQAKNAIRHGIQEGERLAAEKAARKAHNREMHRINQEKADARKAQHPHQGCTVN